MQCCSSLLIFIWFSNNDGCRFSGVYFVVAIFALKETRQSIILRCIAENIRMETGDLRYRARVEETQPTLRELVWISCTRPIRKYPNLDNIITSDLKDLCRGPTH